MSAERRRLLARLETLHVAVPAALLGIVGFHLPAAAAAPSPPRHAAGQGSARPAADAGLVAWLRSGAGSDEAARTIRYSVAKVDLDGDGIAEAIVYESGPYSCGTGGCELYVLRRQAARWRRVANVSLVRPPIRVLRTRSHGWRDLGVAVSGGGIRVGYEAVLSFNGRTYPANPTVAPARRARPGTPGETLLSDKSPQRPLYR